MMQKAWKAMLMERNTMQLQANCILRDNYSVFPSKFKEAEKSQTRNFGGPCTSQLHQTTVNLDASKPDLTLTIPEALGQTTLKRNQSSTSGNMPTEYALRKEQHKADILWVFEFCDISFFSYSNI